MDSDLVTKGFDVAAEQARLLEEAQQVEASRRHKPKPAAQQIEEMVSE